MQYATIIEQFSSYIRYSGPKAGNLKALLHIKPDKSFFAASCKVLFNNCFYSFGNTYVKYVLKMCKHKRLHK